MTSNAKKENMPENIHIFKILNDDWYRFLSKLFAAVTSGTHQFFSEKSIQPALLPITTGSISSPMGLGSDSLPVKISLKGNDIFLADSMQFSLEVAARLNEFGAYYVMPSFRGEDTDARHLNEFFHAEAEIKGTLEDILPLIENYIVYITRHIFKTLKPELEKFITDTSHIESVIHEGRSVFKQVSYSDALEELKGVNGAVRDIETKFPDITPVGERKLLEKYGDFLWLTSLPRLNVPFYQASCDENFSKTADLLAGIGEVIGCGERVYTCEDLVSSLNDHGVSLNSYVWYYEMRKISPQKTSGFGMGIERYLMWLTQKTDIRDFMLLYRDHQNIHFP